MFDLPWGSALDDPETVCQLVEADVQAGFATWLRGGLEKWPGICLASIAQQAVSLGVVCRARLIGDSPVSHANVILCQVSEKMGLPSF